MSIQYPNPSRSFDETVHCVRFWGYDEAIEVAFFGEQDALRKLCPDMEDSEKGYLKAFDTTSVKIYQTAGVVYGKAPREAYVFHLFAKDF